MKNCIKEYAVPPIVLMISIAIAIILILIIPMPYDIQTDVTIYTNNGEVLEFENVKNVKQSKLFKNSVSFSCNGEGYSFDNVSVQIHKTPIINDSFADFAEKKIIGEQNGTD